MAFDFKVGLRWMYSVISYNVKKLSSLPQHTYKKNHNFVYQNFKFNASRGRGSGSRVGQNGNVV